MPKPHKPPEAVRAGSAGPASGRAAGTQAVGRIPSRRYSAAALPSADPRPQVTHHVRQAPIVRWPPVVRHRSTSRRIAASGAIEPPRGASAASGAIEPRIARRRAEQERAEAFFLGERRRNRRLQERDPRGASAASGAIEL